MYDKFSTSVDGIISNLLLQCVIMNNFIYRSPYSFCHFVFEIDSQMWDSVQFSRSVVSDSLRPHELQHARPPCPSPTPRDVGLVIQKVNAGVILLEMTKFSFMGTINILHRHQQ